MKIRNGFVSNSSSSSFIIVVDPDELRETAIKVRLFGDREEIHPQYYGAMDTQEIANRLVTDVKEAYDDMKLGSHAQAELLSAMVDHMTDSKKWDMLVDTFTIDDDNYSNSMRVVYEKWHKYQIDVKEEAKVRLAEIEKANPGKKIVCVEVSDNDGTMYAYLEHGNVFTALWPDAIQVSNH